ncbi:Polynucleotide kinase [Balamuthia mandrillaris]
MPRPKPAPKVLRLLQRHLAQQPQSPLGSLGTGHSPDRCARHKFRGYRSRSGHNTSSCTVKETQFQIHAETREALKGVHQRSVVLQQMFEKQKAEMQWRMSLIEERLAPVDWVWVPVTFHEKLSTDPLRMMMPLVLSHRFGGAVKQLQYTHIKPGVTQVKREEREEKGEQGREGPIARRECNVVDIKVRFSQKKATMQNDEEAGVFPQDITLEEVREAIQGNVGILEYDRGDHVVFSYYIVKQDTFPPWKDCSDPRLKRMYQLRRECRGLVFGSSGELIARRYHKFFNVGEHEDSKPENIDMSQPHVILTKLDGSMVSPFRLTDGRIVFATKKGASPVGDEAEAFAKSVDSEMHYFAFLNECFDQRLTPLFEWCSRKKPIILDYPEDQLVLTGLRHLDSGRYICYPDMLQRASRHNIPVVPLYSSPSSSSSCSSLAEFLVRVKGDKGLEGCVLRFESEEAGGGTMMYKIKTMWYHDLNRGLHMLTKTKANNERFVWRTILDNRYDDMKVYISVDERKRLDRFAEALFSRLERYVQMIEREVGEMRERLLKEEEKKKENEKEKETNQQQLNRKLFADFLQREKNKLAHAVYWKAWKQPNEQVRDCLVEHVLKNIEKRFEEVRNEFFEGLSFADYRIDENERTSQQSFSDWH